MKIRLHPIIPACAWIAAAVALAFALLTPAPAQLRKNATKGIGFRVVEFYESIPGMKAQTNQIKSVLRGAQGKIVSESLVRITQSRLETYPPRGHTTNLVAVSPESSYDPEKHLVFSTNALRLQAMNDLMIVRGRTGYEFSMANNQLFVSNYVRGFIHNSLFRTPKP